MAVYKWQGDKLPRGKPDFDLQITFEGRPLGAISELEWIRDRLVFLFLFFKNIKFIFFLKKYKNI